MAAPDPIAELLDNVQRVGFEDIPPETVDITKRFVLDAVATTMAGANAPMVREVIGLLSRWGGIPESTVVIHGGRLPCHQAALANVLMCHALELDEFHDAAATHALAPAFWSALAAAETMGGCDGNTLLVATIVATDLTHRIGLAADRMYFLGYHKSRLAAFASAAAMGKVLGVSTATLRNAVGIAFCQTAGTIQTLPDGAFAKRLQPAFNASDGMRSVLLARAGITGVRNVLGGRAGLFALYNEGQFDPSLLLADLGRVFLGATASIKRFPSCRCASAPIEATLALARRHAITPDVVDTIEVDVSAGCFAISGAPIATKHGSPQVDAQFSIDYNLAVAMIFGDVFAQHFEPDVIHDPRVRELATRVTVKVDPALDKGALSPATVAIRVKGGREYRMRLEHMRGTPARPMSWDDIVQERLERCAAYSGLAFTADRLTVLSDTVRRLEALHDVRRLIALMDPSSDDDDGRTMGGARG